MLEKIYSLVYTFIKVVIFVAKQLIMSMLRAVDCIVKKIYILSSWHLNYWTAFAIFLQRNRFFVFYISEGLK